MMLETIAGILIIAVYVLPMIWSYILMVRFHQYQSEGLSIYTLIMSAVLPLIPITNIMVFTVLQTHAINHGYKHISFDWLFKERFFIKE